MSEDITDGVYSNKGPGYKVIRVIIGIKWRGEHEKLNNKGKTNTQR